MAIKNLLARKLLPLINKVARLVSLKVVTVHTPNRDFSAFFQHMTTLGFNFKTVIDVGIAFGSPTLYSSTPGAKFILVEPVPACRPLLDRLATELNAQTFNVAAGSKDGTIDFFVHEDVSGSSSYPQLEGSQLDGERVKVPVRRLDSIIQMPILRPCLLKIDTQGAELEVIEGAEGILSQVDVIIIEVSFHEFRAGAPEFHDVLFRMHQLGFRCYEILEGHYRSADNALAQVDLVFVPKGSKLREIKSFFTDAQVEKYLKDSAKSF